MLKLISSRDLRFYVRGELICAKCSETLFVSHVGDLTPMFEAQCYDCGFDAAYARADVRVKVLPERRASCEVVTTAR